MHNPPLRCAYKNNTNTLKKQGKSIIFQTIRAFGVDFFS
jgi:hypothetical protein